MTSATLQFVKVRVWSGVSFRPMQNTDPMAGRSSIGACNVVWSARPFVATLYNCVFSSFSL